jgi:VCBS repeat-containing protein
MTNHNPDITSPTVNDSFSETANTTGSTTTHNLSGTMNFKDSDHSDTHTTSAALTNTAVSGGTAIPTASLTNLQNALTSHIASDSNGSGVIDWSFSAPDDDFDFLAKGQTLTLTYEVTVTDNHGGSGQKAVNITVTGSDDKPIITMSAGATVTEQPDTTLSFAPDVANPTVQFFDADLANVGYTASVVGVAASGVTTGLLPGFLGTAELSAFFHIDSVSKAAGSSSGVINTTFSAPDVAFDYLAAGEQLDITYAVQLNDGAGGTTTQNVDVTVVGTNDAPIYLSGPESANLTEGQNLSSGNLTAHGDLFFSDIDLSDTHTVSTTVTASRSSGGAVPLSDATLLAALTPSLEDSTGHILGEVDWDFALPNSDVNFLMGGETLTLTYDISVTDPSLATTTQVVTVTILGVNNPPVITSGPESDSVAELADTTGSPTLDTSATGGSLAFTDQDTSDTHTVAVSVDSATWSGGSAVPATTLSDLANALATTLNDSTGTGSGSVDWTFSIPDSDLDFLAAGETLTTVYDVKVSDASASATQTVTITAVGANDDVTVTSGPESGSVAEQPDTTGSSTPDTSSPGSLSFTDADLNDTHAVAVSLDSAVWSANPFFVPGQTLSDLQSALATTLNDSTGTGSGSVDWSFSIPDADLDFLAAGETLTATYDVTVSDGAGSSSTQNVVITMTGAEDPLVVNSVSPSISDTAFPDTGTVIGSGNVIIDGADTGGDLSTSLSVTAVDGLASNVDGFVTGAHGSLFVDSSGFYEYIADSSIDPLTVGDNVTDQFNFTVTDSLGRSATTTLTFNINGADDAPIITSADNVGSITEDAGPSTVVNGGFETGNLNGWSASSSAISAGFFGIGGAFGNWAADLGPTASTLSLSQDVATTPGQQYTLSFFVDGDPDSFSNALTVTWDGATILSLTQVPLGFNQYTFTVTGDASASTTPLVFSYVDDADGLLLDQVAVNATTAPATQTAQGTINFSDVETGDTHTASFVPVGGGYVGTFSLDPVSEVPSSGSVEWHFSVDNSAIQFLSQGQTLTQDYLVTVTDENGASTTQDVTIALNGANDPPTANADTVITDVDTSGGSFIPGWALTRNDTDPDVNDSLNVNSAGSSSGGNVIGFPPNGVLFTDDGTLGGLFSYDVTDGIAISDPATVTFDNNAATSTSLTGTSGDDIIIGDNASETLDGGAGNDILIANAGNQTLTGGSGNDIFAFEAPPSSPASIADFNDTTEQDQIAISASRFGGGLTPGMDLSTLFETSSDNQFVSPISLFHFDTGNQTLYFSADGTTGSEVAVTELQAGTELQANNMLIVR